MKNVAKIIMLFGGLDWLRRGDNYVRLEVEGFLRLCVEHVGTGPRGRDLISVCHWGEQNGDAMRDPDVVFEVDPSDDPRAGWASGNWDPVSFRNDYLGVYQEAVWQEGGQVKCRPALIRDLKAFARQWDRNLQDQGFVEAAAAAVARRA